MADPETSSSVLKKHQAEKKLYVVNMGCHSHGPEVSVANRAELVRESHLDMLESCLGSRQAAEDALSGSTTFQLNCCFARLTPLEAERIRSNDKVESVFPNSIVYLATSASWKFLSHGTSHFGGGKTEDMEKIEDTEDMEKIEDTGGIVIGIIDSGVWPISKSFDDYGYTAIPEKWRGECEVGSFHGEFMGNKKLIGARVFPALPNIIDPPSRSPWDVDGHGTHCISIAAGSAVMDANVPGLDNIALRGMAPRARVASYKVFHLNDEGTSGADDVAILEAFDAAIEDGVDIISVSAVLRGAQSLKKDCIAMGSLAAVKKGVLVVCAAGNDGPSKGVVGNCAPWQITVAASTTDRSFRRKVILGDGSEFEGEGLSYKALLEKEYLPLILASEAVMDGKDGAHAQHCLKGTIDPAKAEGKILVCHDAIDEELSRVKASGIIIVNKEEWGNDYMNIRPHVLPSCYVSFDNGEQIKAYINSNREASATITPTSEQRDRKPAPIVAKFSSRGPNKICPWILKPDVTAPGVDILAAYTQARAPILTPDESESMLVEYHVMSGTSMACPHVAGIAAMVKTVHPEWNPAEIRSAIMTTATTSYGEVMQICDHSSAYATPFDIGAGHVRVDKAMDPGLVYDVKPDSYDEFARECKAMQSESLSNTQANDPLFGAETFRKKISVPEKLLNFNYPAIAIPDLSESIIISRTLKNVGPQEEVLYECKITNPFGVLVSVRPTVLRYKAIGEEKTFKVSLEIDAPRSYIGQRLVNMEVFGDVTWYDATHEVRTPITAHVWVSEVQKAELVRSSKRTRT